MSNRRSGPVCEPHAAWTPDVYLHIVLPEASCYHAPLLDAHGDRPQTEPDVRVLEQSARDRLVAHEGRQHAKPDHQKGHGDKQDGRRRNEKQIFRHDVLKYTGE